MADKVYVVDGRQFRTKADYDDACADQKIIEELSKKTPQMSDEQLEKLIVDVRKGRYHLKTILGRDFADELEAKLKKNARNGKSNTIREKSSMDIKSKNTRSEDKEDSTEKKIEDEDPVLQKYIQEELRKRTFRRKFSQICCIIVALLSFGAFGIYYFQYMRVENHNKKISQLKEKPYIGKETTKDSQVVIHYTDTPTKEVLPEYKNLLNVNQRLIGWLKIDDNKYIDCPVMQTVDNEYYLDHDFEQNYDKNGSIFMDKDCDVIKPSMNYILYGHHMKSGQMFGTLSKYSDENYFKTHEYINFDTIYEHGLYRVMYVFRSRVYSEEDVNFKYYQFIDANGPEEFDSYMREMADISLYDTGVTASYGDQLLTLSTCDYQEKNGRFVVVAKKVTAKE